MGKQGLGCRRLVLVLFPLQGHINPMLRLGTILHSRGFSITVVHTQFNSPNTFNHPDFLFLVLSDNSSLEISDSDGLVVSIRNLNLNCKASLQELLTQIVEEREQHEGLPCIIYDALMYSVEEVAHSLKLPSIILRTSSAISWLASLAYPQLREKGCIPPQGSKSMELVPGLDPLRFKDLPIIIGNEDTLLRLTATVRNIGTSSAIIWNSMDCLEQSSLAQLQQQCQVPSFSIGPMQKMAPTISSTSIWEEDHSCITWLDKQSEDSVVYVSFGSMAVLGEKEVAEIAWGLANSKQPFLWVLRPAGSGNGINSVNLLSDGFKEIVGERGCIVNWAPQEQVLAHRAVGGFLTHCGWNSTIESICEGVPMICYPNLYDQPVNSRYISHVWRVGIELENGLVREEIETAIKRLMAEKEGEEIRRRTINLKLKAEFNIQEDGPSYNSLNKLVEFIKSV